MTNENPHDNSNEYYEFYDDVGASNSGYEVEPVALSNPQEQYAAQNEGGPYVLATLRNVFSSETTDDYEYVYEEQEQGPPQEELNHDLLVEHDLEEETHSSKVYHPCPHCNKQYTSERRLKHHVEVHKNKDAYKCAKCGYCYQSPDSLKRHMKKNPDCDRDNDPDASKSEPGSSTTVYPEEEDEEEE